jgi:hypothetical protein
MDPATILSLATVAIDLVEKLLPAIDQLRLKGNITAEQQQQVRARYESLKARADGQFSGPEWQKA